jgi:hypothetical protein
MIWRRRGLHAVSGSTLRGFLFVLWIATSVVVRAEDRVQAEFDRVAKMSAAEQQAWLQQLEQRAARAARLTLSPKEAARHVAHTDALLHQKTVTWKVLREVIEDTEARERAAKPKAVKRGSVAKPQAVKVGETAKPQAARGTGTAKPPAEEAAAAVKVNVEELESQIAASNLALRELEAELTEKTAWSAAKLEPLADRLKTLVVRHNDLGLFREALPKGQRAEVTKLETPKSAISQLSARVVEARNRTNDSQFTGDDVERRAELARLDAVSHRLAELAGK